MQCVYSVSLQVGRFDSSYYSACSRRDDCKYNCIVDNYPRIRCGPISTSLNYGGNVYSKLYAYYYTGSSGWQTCAQAANDNLNGLSASPLFDGRLPRVQACFQGCNPNGNTTTSVFKFNRDPNVLIDNRQLVCIFIHLADSSICRSEIHVGRSM
jgi:hypothetical protein